MRPLRRIPPVVPFALVLGVLWWWAVLRLAWVPGEAGPVEGAVAVGGWGLGLLPVHCAQGPVRRARRAALTEAPEVPDGAAAAREPAAGAAVTRASTLRRSGGGSGPS
ncbi:hypothetical protein ACFXA3_09535 [Streptomyces sp. NPDC059456]|uniref:hypothetical protein n=1 Tax=Streptomyces sp. NPDC059456 TaxID=3346838 RepID=UPI0036C1DC04